MLENWLSPVNDDAFLQEEWEAFQLGRHIRMYSGQLPDLEGVQLAILGIGERETDAIRQEFYRLSFPFEGLLLADLGNLRRKTVSFAIPAIKELLDSKIFPILLAPDPVFTLAQYKAFQSIQALASLVLVDERLRFQPGGGDPKRYFLNELLEGKSGRPFHLGLIGIQTHFVDPGAFRYLEQQNFDLLRLGRAKADLPELEPILRDGDLLSIHLACLKGAEAPGVADLSPSGFFLEEACQICRYAGMSDKLKSFGIFGYRHNLDRRNRSAQAVAQMLWYFIDGFYNRKQDYPASTEGLVEYIVDFKKLDYQLTFWKSQKSSRWWMQVPVKTNKQQQRHRLIPCTYNDYKLASQEELPDRLLNAFKRFS